MQEHYIIPTIGQFKITITPEYNPRNKSNILYYILNVGGNFDKCVNLTLHPKDSPDSKKIILSWTEIIDKECTVNSQIIKGQATITMLNLAFTIAKQFAPYAEYVLFHDMSYFYCDTPEGNKKISLPPYHIAFHDKTWYEDKFKATMTNEDNYIKYKQYIKNMYKEEILYETFNFGNVHIKEILYPLYIEAKTWKQFFKLINNKYPNNKCILMYPWINNAMNIIFEGNAIYAGQEWKILLSNIPKIHYYEIGKITGGVITNNKYMIQYDDYRVVNYNDTNKWDINRFIHNKKYKYTKKRKILKKKRNTKINKKLLY